MMKNSNMSFILKFTGCTSLAQVSCPVWLGLKNNNNNFFKFISKLSRASHLNPNHNH